jgi:DNA-binding beta-propeller fold protein YncE
VLAAISLSAVGPGGVGAAGAATRAAREPGAGAHALAGPGARLWTARYNGPGSGADVARQVAVSPGGDKVYVTGSSAGDGTGPDYTTAAYSASTGARLWVARYNDPAGGTDTAASVAVSPDGARVYVTGIASGSDYTTVAYNAATGAQLWVTQYPFLSPSFYGAVSVAVSPDGNRVFLSGTVSYPQGGQAFATIAYNPATGARLWVARYAFDPYGGTEALVVSPDGKRVYVTGWSPDTKESYYTTVAYNAGSGTRLWVARYIGPDHGDDTPSAMAVSPDGSKVYVTGADGYSIYDYATIAYNAATGARLWVRRYNGPGNGSDYATSLAVSPAGTIVVTGVSQGAASDKDYATIAYSATGTRLWAKRYNGPGNGTDIAWSVVAPGNGKVYVTGQSWDGSTSRNDYATIAYSVFNGDRLWLQRYNGPPGSGDYAYSVLARTGRVFVTGASYGVSSGLDYATIAYKG